MNDTKPQSNLFSTVIWLMLVVLTITTFSLGEAGVSGKGVMLTLLAITMIKSQLVANYFMSLRKTRFLWRAIMPVSYTHLDVYKRQVLVSYKFGYSASPLHR